MKETALMQKYEKELARTSDLRLLTKYKNEIQRACNLEVWIERAENQEGLSDAACLIEWMDNNGYVINDVTTVRLRS